MVVGVDNKNEVHGLGKIGALCARQYGNQHAQIFMMRALTKVTEHFRFDIDGKQLSFGYQPGDPDAEISGAGT